MKKSYYFSHDYNARTDEKIRKLIRRHGMLGYGVYWAIIEDLYNNNNDLSFDVDQIAYDLRVDENLIDSVVNDFDLFIVDSGFFGSNSVGGRLEKIEQKSERAKNSAEKRWLKSRVNPVEEVSDLPQVYILRMYNNDEEFIKVGHTTSQISRRYSGKLPYKYEIIEQIFVDGDVLDVEVWIQESIKKYRIKPLKKFAGHLECYDVECLNELKTLDINTLSNVRTSSHFFAQVRNAIKERKGKENKRKENKGNKKGVILPFDSKDFAEHWQWWKEYKKDEHRFKYKSRVSEQAALKKLATIGKDEATCKKIIMQSIENGWKGFFEIKKDGETKQRKGVSQEELDAVLRKAYG